MAINIPNRFQRMWLHFNCLLKNPSDWNFYFKGIIREILKK